MCHPVFCNGAFFRVAALVHVLGEIREQSWASAPASYLVKKGLSVSAAVPCTPGWLAYKCPSDSPVYVCHLSIGKLGLQIELMLLSAEPFPGPTHWVL